jgi:hypothetical protein
MDRRLKVIAHAVRSARLAEVAVGYIYTLARENSSAKDSVAGFLRNKLIVAAAENRSVDAWTNELNAIGRSVVLQDDVTENDKRGFAQVLTELCPFVKKVSIALAADMITKRREAVYTSDLFEGEDLVVGGILIELSQLAEASGNFELAAEFMDKAVEADFPDDKDRELTRLTDALDARAKLGTGTKLGTTTNLGSLTQIARELKRREPEVAN